MIRAPGAPLRAGAAPQVLAEPVQDDLESHGLVDRASGELGGREPLGLLPRSRRQRIRDHASHTISLRENRDGIAVHSGRG
jgi:hypothetical protein